MRKRLTGVCMALLLMVCMTMTAAVDVKASREVPMVDGSYLTHDTEATGYADQMTRGEDLLTGYSKGVRQGAGLFYAGGTTIAAHVVPSVQISVMVERMTEEDTDWSFYTGWRAENLNASRVAANKRLEVEGDYYYRVRCIHSAGKDVSSSFTDGLWIPKP